MPFISLVQYSYTNDDFSFLYSFSILEASSNQPSIIVCISLVMTGVLQETPCSVELTYNMDEGLKTALKESAATSVVHSVGQRVFLHNLHCTGIFLPCRLALPHTSPLI